MLLSASALLFLAEAVVAQGTWASVPVTGPEIITDGGGGTFHWHYAEVYVGNPPQNQSLTINLWSTMNFIFGSECLFCPGDRVFDPSLSQTLNDTNTPWAGDAADFRGDTATDSFNFGGVLQADNVTFGIINYVSSDYKLRFSEGHLGLFVHPTNETKNQRSLLYNLWNAGKLQQPVIGLSLRGKRPRLSIGALDPNDFDGEINWVEATPPSDTSFPTVFPIDGIKGHQGNPIPNVAPGTLVTLDTLSKNIYIPPLAYSSYFMNESLVGPQELINIYPSGGMSVGCNYTTKNMNSGSAYAPFSVDINGVNYPVEHKDMIRPQSMMSTNRTCNTALQNSTLADDTPVTLGISFLRSVYLAYKFPTKDCPKAFYGFAYPKGAANRTLTQTPRSVPSDAAQCLLGQITASKPTSTPTPTKSIEFPVRTLDSNVRDPLPGERTYKVFGLPDHAEVVLRDVDGVPFVEERQAGDDDGRGGFFA